MFGDRVRHSFSSPKWRQCAFVDHSTTIFFLGDMRLENLKVPWRKRICLKEIVDFIRLDCFS